MTSNAKPLSAGFALLGLLACGGKGHEPKKATPPPAPVTQPDDPAGAPPHPDDPAAPASPDGKPPKDRPLPKLTVISGQITDRATSLPLAGVEVLPIMEGLHAFDGSVIPLKGAITDANGQYTLSLFPALTIRVVCQASIGGRTYGTEVSDPIPLAGPKADAIVNLALASVPQGGRIEVPGLPGAGSGTEAKIVLIQKKTVGDKNLELALRSLDWNIAATTFDGVPPGNYVVRLRGGGPQHLIPVTVRAGETAHVALPNGLRAPGIPATTGTLTGRLVDRATSHPLAGVEVLAQVTTADGTTYVYRSLKTRTDGSYTFPYLPFGMTFRVISQPRVGAVLYGADASEGIILSRARSSETVDLAFSAAPLGGRIEVSAKPASATGQMPSITLFQQQDIGGTRTAIAIRRAEWGSHTTVFEGVPAGTYEVLFRATSYGPEGRRKSVTVTAGGTGWVQHP